MTNNNKNFKKKKLKIDAPEGWINLLNEYLEKNKEFINIDEAIRTMVRSYIDKRLLMKKQILTDYDKGYIQGYADAKELDSKDLIWKGFSLVTK